MKTKVLKPIYKILIIAFIALAIFAILLFKKSTNTPNDNIETTQKEYKSEQEKIDFSMDIENGDLNIERLTSYGVPVIIDFGADYCEPCRKYQPTLREIKEQYGDNVIIKIVDIQDNPELANKYEMSTIPAQLFYNADGTPYIPSDDMSGNIEYKRDENDNIIYTKHISGSSQNKVKVLLYEMGLDNYDEISEFYTPSIIRATNKEQEVEVNK